MRLKQLAIAITLGTISTVALAENTGFYVGGKLGASIMQSKDMQSHGHFYSTPTNYDYTLTKDKTKAVFNLGVNAGYDFNVSYNIPVRAELDYTYRTDAKINTSTYVFSSMDGNAGGDDEAENFKIRQSTLMANGYYDFYNSTAFTPYVGLGLGVSFVKYKDEASISKTKFAWSTMAGVSYKVMSNLTANVEYRYLDSGKIKKDDSDGTWVDNFSAKLKTHDINIGLRYAF
ncbi:porin family protein [Orbus wheelerorum]|uniref:outer membrane protein n=1 Tax=Orbus wheelerorum TaxID=3074111 RepID=UPI00370DA599